MPSGSHYKRFRNLVWRKAFTPFVSTQLCGSLSILSNVIWSHPGAETCSNVILVMNCDLICAFVVCSVDFVSVVGISWDVIHFSSNKCDDFKNYLNFSTQYILLYNPIFAHYKTHRHNAAKFNTLICSWNDWNTFLVCNEIYCYVLCRLQLSLLAWSLFRELNTSIIWYYY